MNTNENRSRIIRLTGREHLLHLSGIKSGKSESHKELAAWLKSSANQYDASLKEFIQKNKNVKQLQPVIEQLVANCETMAKHLSDKSAELMTESNILLDRAVNSDQGADPNRVSLRKKIKRAIIDALGEPKGR